jgi:prevent-host-death family protein
MEVGVRELRQRLSFYLAAVEAGAEILVTDRGRPEVRIIPVSGAGSLQRGLREGWIHPAVSERRVGTAPRHRSLDAIHLASAQQLQIPGLPFLTFDLRQAQAARSLGLVVLGS